eukprot:jgi/Tetstr1/465981/TSEL_010572.t1
MRRPSSVVGKGIANAAGEFAIVLDTPLDPGAHAVTLETRDDAGTVKSASRQSIAVSVPEDPASGEADDTSRDVAALTETAAETAKDTAQPPAQFDTTPAASEAPATPSSAQPAEQRAADATPDASPAPSTTPSTEVAAAPATDSPAATETPAGETAGPAPDTPATPRIVPDSGTVVARAQVTFERVEDAIVLRPVSATGTAGEGDGASASTGARQIPSIIIRSGDNLWTISQRRYGEGLRYTTIYQANKDQIRNPDLIYPGQVFMIPEGDRNWPVAN